MCMHVSLWYLLYFCVVCGSCTRTCIFVVCICNYKYASFTYMLFLYAFLQCYENNLVCTSAVFNGALHNN